MAELRETGRVRIRGLREYQDKLQQLGEGMVARGCVIALAPGADLLRNAVRQRTPLLQVPDYRRKVGTVRDAIQAMRVGAGAGKRSIAALAAGVTYVIGIRLLASRAISAFKRRTGRSGSENPNDPFYGTILEFGRTPRTRHPFLRPAFQTAAEPAVKLAGEKLAEFTDAEIRRLGAQRP